MIYWETFYFVFFFVRLECLIASGDETCEAGDLDLIQHMNVDMLKLTRLLNGKKYLSLGMKFLK